MKRLMQSDIRNKPQGSHAAIQSAKLAALETSLRDDGNCDQDPIERAMALRWLNNVSMKVPRTTLQIFLKNFLALKIALKRT